MKRPGIALGTAICGIAAGCSAGLHPATGPTKADWPLELDHIAVFVSPRAPERAALCNLGLVDTGHTAHHEDQGTASIGYIFDNSYLELVWVENEEAFRRFEARDGGRSAARFEWRRTGASPFGLGLRYRGGRDAHPPFAWRAYEPSWLRRGTAIQVARDHSAGREPTVFVVPSYMALPAWLDSSTAPRMRGRHIAGVRIALARPHALSNTARILAQHGVLQFESSDAPLLTLTIDAGTRAADLRPELPMLVRY